MAKMPRAKIVSAWASFLKEEEMSVEDAIKRTSSFEMEKWLEENATEIKEAIEEKETAVATFETPAKFVEEKEVEKEVEESKSSKGVRI